MFWGNASAESQFAPFQALLMMHDRPCSILEQVEFATLELGVVVRQPRALHLAGVTQSSESQKSIRLERHMSIFHLTRKTIGTKPRMIPDCAVSKIQVKSW